MSDAINLLVNLKPEEIISWFESKGFKFSWDWQDTWREAHSKSFTVAKAMKLDILKEIKKEVDKIFNEGTTFDQFKRNLEPTLKRLGWWGKVRAKDVPGYEPESGIDPEKIVQLGSPKRLKTIYTVNSLVAYNAGRYRSQFANAVNRPYWLYQQLQRKTKRDAHVPFHNKVFMYNDPIWDTIYPPSDWMCGCYIRALNKQQLNSMGLTVSKGKDFSLDSIPKEWRYNPGKTVLWDMKGHLPPCPNDISFASADKKKKCMKIISTKTWKDFDRPDIRNLPKEYFQQMPELLEPGKDKEDGLLIITNALNLSAAQPIVTVETPIEPVIINKDYLSHLVEKRTDQRERFSNFIIPTLKNPFEIYLTEYEDGPRRQYIGLFEGKYNLLTVIRINPDGSLLFWNMMHSDKAKMNKNRAGNLIWYK